MNVKYLLKLKSYLIHNGYAVAPDGLLADPFQPNKNVRVTDARSFGYRPLVTQINTDRSEEDYIGHWFPQTEWELDENLPFYLDYASDLAAVSHLEKQSDCPLTGDELGLVNPFVLAAADKSDIFLGIVLRLNERFSYVVNSGKDSVYDQNTGALMSWATFDRLIASDRYRSADADPVPSAVIWRSHPLRRTYYGASFFPLGRDPNGDLSDGTKVNLWRGFPAIIVRGDGGSPAVIQGHIEEVFHQGNQTTANWEHDYWAHLLQKPWEKPHANIVRCEREGGSGKDIFAKMLREKIVGEENSAVLVGNKALTTQFNAHLATALLVVGNEIAWAGDHESRNLLWGETGGDTRSLERKGVDRITVPNYSRYLIHSNNDRPVAASLGDRRFGIFETLHWSAKFPDGIGSEAYQTYFENLAAACKSPDNVAAYVRFLRGRNLQNFNPYMAPATEAKHDLMMANLQAREAWLFGVAKMGGFRDSDDNFHPIGIEGNAALVAGSVVVADARKAFLKVSPNVNVEVAVGMYLGKPARRPGKALAQKVYAQRFDQSLGKEPHFDFGDLKSFREGVAERLGIPIGLLICED